MGDAAPAGRARWKVPLICVGLLLAALVAPVILVGSGAPALAPLPPPDRDLVVPLPDGTEATLGALLDGTVPPPEKKTRDVELEMGDGTVRVFQVPLPPTNDLLTVGMHHGWRGNTELAIECLERIPRGHPDWSRAQRFLGLRVYARSGDPSRGLAHVHAALAADPMEGNAWQDAARVYLQAFGIDSQ